MNFDLRLPIGILFSLIGLVLGIEGLITRGSSGYDRSLGININLWWGCVLILFGAVMLFLSRKKNTR